MSDPALTPALVALVHQIRPLGLAEMERIEGARRLSRNPANGAWTRGTAAIVEAGLEPTWKAATFAIFDACMAIQTPQNVRYAAYDAAIALLVRERISQADFQILYGPWVAGSDRHLIAA